MEQSKSALKQIPCISLEQPLIYKQWKKELFSIILDKSNTGKSKMGDNKMEIEIKIDKNCTQPKITVVTKEMTDELNEIIKRISEKPSSILVGFLDEQAVVLEPSKIIRIYAANQRVYAVANDGEYIVRLRLFEVEERLQSLGFVRISNSEIINLKMVKSFDLGFTGTICVHFKTGATSFVSRRYVTRIKEILGM